MSTKLVKLPIRLHEQASAMSETRGITIGAALELMTARAENQLTMPHGGEMAANMGNDNIRVQQNQNQSLQVVVVS